MNWLYRFFRRHVTRSFTETVKVSTSFGNIFAHVEWNNGKVAGISFSTQGRLHDSTIGNALDALSEAVNAAIGEV